MSFICQQVQHEVRFVIREMDVDIQLHEYEPNPICNPILVRILAGALELA